MTTNMVFCSQIVLTYCENKLFQILRKSLTIRGFAKVLRSLKQCIQTVKGQYVQFLKQNLFSNLFWRVLKSDNQRVHITIRAVIIQIGKNGSQKPTGGVRKSFFYELFQTFVVSEWTSEATIALLSFFVVWLLLEVQWTQPFFIKVCTCKFLVLSLSSQLPHFSNKSCVFGVYNDDKKALN